MSARFLPRREERDEHGAIAVLTALVSVVLLVVAGLAVAAAAVWLEQCCRTPDDRDDERSR